MKQRRQDRETSTGCQRKRDKVCAAQQSWRMTRMNHLGLASSFFLIYFFFFFFFFFDRSLRQLSTYSLTQLTTSRILGIKKQHSIFDLGLGTLYLLELTLPDCPRASSGKQLHNKLKCTCDYKDTLLDSARSVRASAKNHVSVLSIIKSRSLNFPHNYIPRTWNLE